jgi:hypothetical protein
MVGRISPLLFLLASAPENDLRRHIEFLKAENVWEKPSGQNPSGQKPSGQKSEAESDFV